MKTSHIVFFLFLLLWLRNKKQPQAAAPLAAGTVTSGDATLRRDMDEQIAQLVERIEKLEESPYA